MRYCLRRGAGDHDPHRLLARRSPLARAGCAAIASCVQAAGLALAGLVALVLPGVTQPSWLGASLMVIAGIAWGLYSLRGRGNARPIATTAGNFLRASLPACVLAVVMQSQRQWDSSGVGYAALSGAIASGVGYAIWYSALPYLRPTQAATVQLSVPVLTAVGGVWPARGDADPATRALFRGGAGWHRLDPHNAMGCAKRNSEEGMKPAVRRENRRGCRVGRF